MIVVTGAAGFIGSNLVLGLNARGVSNILAVDDLQDGVNHVQEPLEVRAQHCSSRFCLKGDWN